MKLLINNKYQEVDFWSFLKCQILTQIAFTVMLYGSLIVLILLFAFFGLLE